MASYLLGMHQCDQCNKFLDVILESEEIAVAVVADRKGGLLAEPGREYGADAARVADLAAKVIGLGNELAKVQSPSSQDIAICDLKGSPMVVLPAGEALLCVVGARKANMGLVVGIARDAARKLASMIAEAMAIKTTPSGQQPVENGGFVFDADGLTARVLQDLEARATRQEGSEGDGLAPETA